MAGPALPIIIGGGVKVATRYGPAAARQIDKIIRNIDKFKFSLPKQSSSGSSTGTNLTRTSSSRQLQTFRNMRLRLRNSRAQARNRVSARARQRLDRRGYFRRGARSRAGMTKLDDMMDLLPYAALPGLFGGGDDEGDDASFIPGGGDDMDGGPAIVGAGMGAIDPAEAISSSSIGYDSTGVEGKDVLSALINIQVILNKARGQLHTIEVTNSKIAASVVKPGYQQARESLGGAAAAGGGARGFMQGVRAAMQNPVGRVKSGLGFAAKLAAIAGFLAAMFGDIRDKVFAAFVDMGNAIANIANDISDSVAKMFDSTVDYVDGLMGDIGNAIDNVYGDIIDSLPEDIMTNEEGEPSFLNQMIEEPILTTKTVWNNFLDGVKAKWISATETLANWGNSVQSWFSGIVSSVTESEIYQNLSNLLQEGVQGLHLTEANQILQDMWEAIKPGGGIDQWIQTNIKDKASALLDKIPVPANFQLLNKIRNGEGVDVDGVVDQNYANEFVDMEKSIEKSLTNNSDYVHAQALRDNTGNGNVTNVIDNSKKTVNNGTLGTSGPPGNQGGNPFYDHGKKTSHIDIRVSLNPGAV